MIARFNPSPSPLPPVFTRLRRSSQARSTSRPTTIEVRDATVGPLLGTRAVSASATTTSSGVRPSRAAASAVKTVIVPCPISMFADSTSMRPSGRPATSTREESITSPLPVKPAPWWKVAMPMPRRVVPPALFAARFLS